MKKGIMINLKGHSNWIGGLYYSKNIAYVLTQNENIRNNYNIYVISEKKKLEQFGYVDGVIKVKTPKNTILSDIYKILFGIFHRVKYVYLSQKKLSIFGMKSIAWIPDFQHNILPQNFSEDEVRLRNNMYAKLFSSGIPVVLSSNDALGHARKYYGNLVSSFYVVPFVSYIENELRIILDGDENSILKKYGLENSKYIMISNQFWKHKNHSIVFEAIKLMDEFEQNCVFVFTGSPKDYRDEIYINYINQLINDSKISKHIKILGFIERIEQLIIMKNAEYIIQPSLFEGWGTVVEDAKVLDKTIILSDIPVHREQMNEKCILFDPYNAEDLAKIIENENKKEHNDDIKNGLNDMHKRAEEYSREFEKLFADLERK